MPPLIGKWNELKDEDQLTGWVVSLGDSYLEGIENFQLQVLFAFHIFLEYDCRSPAIYYIIDHPHPHYAIIKRSYYNYVNFNKVILYAQHHQYYYPAARAAHSGVKQSVACQSVCLSDKKY